MKNNRGFTLIELIVVMAILAVLALIGLGSFRSTQIKSRDIRRKSDLEQLQRALEMYHNDYSSYPLSEGGEIKIGETSFGWGDELVDVNGTVYMKELPNDPKIPQYCYLSVNNGTSYAVYAMLENDQDPAIIISENACNGTVYNYGVSSSDVNP